WQPAAIVMRIAQPVDVVAAQAGQPSSGDELTHLDVDCLEYCFVLDAQCGEIVDIEEPAVVDIASRERPIGNPVMLALEQMMQGDERTGLPRARIECAQAGLDYVFGPRDRGK